MSTTMTLRRRSILALFTVLPSLGAVSRVQAQPTPATPPLRVVASFSILADMAREVGGPDVEVQALVGPNADAHVFQPTPADARRVAGADLVVVNGLGFEGWIDRLVKSAGYRGPMVVASAGVTPRRGEAGHGHGEDPHAWQDLRNAMRYVANLRDAFARARPAQAADFERRAQAYSDRLQTLDAEVRSRFDAIAKARRRILTSHDAFGYFGAAYGIDLLSPQGINTEAEPSSSTVARLIRQIRAREVSAVFMENISNPRLVEQIASEAGVQVGGRLYSDALSPPGTEADTYVKLFAFNARAIAAALASAR